MPKSIPPHATASLTVESPVGALVLLASERGLCGLFFGHRITEEDTPAEDNSNPFLQTARSQLVEYFARQRETFDVPFDFAGTEFQRSVWEQLSAIPFGETRCYMDIARHLDNPGAVRAVGLANGSNPISIIIPCHRVIGADGSLTGFGGGLPIKRQLLEHEGALLAIS